MLFFVALEHVCVEVSGGVLVVISGVLARFKLVALKMLIGRIWGRREARLAIKD